MTFRNLCSTYIIYVADAICSARDNTSCHLSSGGVTTLRIWPLSGNGIRFYSRAILKTVESMRARANPGLEIVGLALVRFEPTRHAREVAALLGRRFGELLLPQVVRKTVRLQDAQLYSQPITSYDTHSAGAEDYRALSAAILERLPITTAVVVGAR